ncbi:aldehyde dehydrogenase family protein [Anoxybacterium hadale]|uniref:Aldehyde dehydrogenase family protein n=1 Tax=Anoxybacterium hadale TaxID=3408580 RepID=A0ACD1A9R6_9FIRM|nr:aldehyde dehydrogenase family protein [Clostridiales bacterium]
MSVNYAEYVAGLVAKGHAAQKIAEGFSQEKVDQLTAAVAYALTQPDVALKFGEMLVEESGMGIPADKQAKMFGKVKGSYYQMKGQKSVGLVEVDEKMGMEKYAKPMGVIGAIIPVTNGEATPVVKSLMALKTRNSIILAPHPKARNTNWAVTEMIRSVLKKFDAPEDLVQAVGPDFVSIETSGELMKQVDFILATGGTPMVRQAYSSGNPAIGVGTGNVVTIVDGTTDMDDVAALIVRSKTFDNATSCSTENNIIVFEECYDAFVEAMAKKGAVLFKDGSEEKAKLLKAIWPESPANHDLNRHIVAQPAAKIAEMAGIEVPEGTKMLMAEENAGFGNEFPFTGEKLSPVAGVRKAKDFDDAVEKMMSILDYQGKGHSCGIHTTIDERVTKLGELVPVCKVCVNAPQSLTNSGSWTSGFPMSMTLGCGTWGHNSISHNATWKDLLNFTYVSRPIPSYQPKDEDLFDEEIRNAFK